MTEIIHGEAVMSRWRMWAEQINKIHGPGVYKIYCSDTGRLLYVGMSENMAKRIFGGSHHIASTISNIEIEFLATPNLRTAAHLEIATIEKEKPIFNKLPGGEHPAMASSRWCSKSKTDPTTQN